MITINNFTEQNEVNYCSAKIKQLTERLCSGSYQTGVKDAITEILIHFNGENLNEVTSAIYAEAFGIESAAASEQLRRSVHIRKVARSCAHDPDFCGMPD